MSGSSSAREALPCSHAHADAGELAWIAPCRARCSRRSDRPARTAARPRVPGPARRPLLAARAAREPEPAEHARYVSRCSARCCWRLVRRGRARPPARPGTARAAVLAGSSPGGAARAVLLVAVDCCSHRTRAVPRSAIFTPARLCVGGARAGAVRRDAPADAARQALARAARDTRPTRVACLAARDRIHRDVAAPRSTPTRRSATRSGRPDPVGDGRHLRGPRRPHAARRLPRLYGAAVAVRRGRPMRAVRRRRDAS